MIPEPGGENGNAHQLGTQGGRRPAKQSTGPLNLEDLARGHEGCGMVRCLHKHKRVHSDDDQG
jgi:hypothetical protein